ncbi:MAG: AtpZ/AtpI family protein [Alphaproteobacteria bacterium]|nr:AtpZ/AtpI family protein [Alphaproteobacteria bacterium]
MAFRVGTELVSALMVGVGVGWLLDRWLGTKPWLLIVFFFLGAAAGVFNVYRAINGMSMTPGFRKDDGRAETKKDGSDADGKFP